MKYPRFQLASLFIITKEVKLVTENIESNNIPAPDSNITGAFDDAKPNINEYLKSGFICAPADHVRQEESDNESVAANVVAEFESKKETWSENFVQLGKDLICFDVNEITSEEQVEDAVCDDNATENDNKELVEVTDKKLSASFKESVSKDTSGAKEVTHDYNETFYSRNFRWGMCQRKWKSTTR